MTDEQRERHREWKRQYDRERRERMTSEDREAEALYRKVSRLHMTEEQLEARRKYQREYMRKRRAQETPEQRERRLAGLRECKRRRAARERGES
jgi:hypothetical protein